MKNINIDLDQYIDQTLAREIPQIRSKTTRNENKADAGSELPEGVGLVVIKPQDRITSLVEAQKFYNNLQLTEKILNVENKKKDKAPTPPPMLQSITNMSLEKSESTRKMASSAEGIKTYERKRFD